MRSPATKRARTSTGNISGAPGKVEHPYGETKHGKRTLDDVLFSLRIDSLRLRHYRRVAQARKGTPHEAAAARDAQISGQVLDRLLVEFKTLGGLEKAS